MAGGGPSGHAVPATKTRYELTAKLNRLCLHGLFYPLRPTPFTVGSFADLLHQQMMARMSVEEGSYVINETIWEHLSTPQFQHFNVPEDPNSSRKKKPTCDARLILAQNAINRSVGSY